MKDEVRDQLLKHHAALQARGAALCGASGRDLSAARVLLARDHLPAAGGAAIEESGCARDADDDWADQTPEVAAMMKARAAKRESEALEKRRLVSISQTAEECLLELQQAAIRSRSFGASETLAKAITLLNSASQAL